MPLWVWGLDDTVRFIALVWVFIVCGLVAWLIVLARPRTPPTGPPHWTGLSRSAVQRLRAAARRYLNSGGAYPVELREWLQQSTTWMPTVVMRELDLSQSEAFRILHKAGFRPGPHPSGVWQRTVSNGPP